MKKAAGQKSFLKYRSGEPLSPKEAILAKCYDCQSFYMDFSGKTKDCGVKDCPLYPYHPYSSDKSRNLLSLNAKRRGLPQGKLQKAKAQETNAKQEAKTGTEN